MNELPKPRSEGICPYCGKGVCFNELQQNKFISYPEEETSYQIIGSRCPLCKRVIVIRQKSIHETIPNQGSRHRLIDDLLLLPRVIKRPIPKGVPPEIAKDYKEACEVLTLSPRASAALSRRCLQHIIHEAAGIKKNNLYEEIESVKSHLPPYLQTLIDLVRKLGNIAVHPKKDKETGLILDVEPKEADLMLTTLEGLLDFYYVQAEKWEKAAEDINKKYEKKTD